MSLWYTYEHFHAYDFAADADFIRGLQAVKSNGDREQREMVLWHAKAFYYSKKYAPVTIPQYFEFLKTMKGKQESSPSRKVVCPYARGGTGSGMKCPFSVRRDNAMPETRYRSEIISNCLSMQNVPMQKGSLRILKINRNELWDSNFLHLLVRTISNCDKDDCVVVTNSQGVFFPGVESDSEGLELLKSTIEDTKAVVIVSNGPAKLSILSLLSLPNVMHICTENAVFTAEKSSDSPVELVRREKREGLQRLISLLPQLGKSLYAADLVYLDWAKFIPFNETEYLYSLIEKEGISAISTYTRIWCGISDFDIFQKEIEQHFGAEASQNLKETDWNSIKSILRGPTPA